MDTKFLQLTGLATLLLVMTACAVVQPFPIPADNPTLASVQANIDANKNHHVAWGGVILGIEVKQTSSMITMLAKPLDNFGQPVQLDQSSGRFLARFNGFIDPAIFTGGRQLTVSGTIEGSETRKIGEFDYVLPVVNVDNYRLWSIPAPQNYNAAGYVVYDPWYPWYPAYPLYPAYPAYPVYPPPYPVYPPPQHGPAPRK